MPKTPLLSLAAGVLPDFTPVQCAKAAAASDWDATGLWVDFDYWTDATTREVRTILRDTGIRALDVEVVWFREGPPNDDHRRVIDIGREVGAANALVVSSDPDSGATAEKLRILCEHAAGDIRVSLEFGLFTEVKSIAAARDIIARADHPAAGMLIDPLHLARTGGTPEAVATLDRRWFPYAQFCDAGPLTFDTADVGAIIEEAVDGRLMPGDGVLPLHALLAALPDAVPLSVELRSKALRDGYPDPVERAAALSRATRAFFAQAADAPSLAERI